MDPHLADLIDALPGEIKEPARTRLRTSLQGLLENLGQRPVPVGRLNRGWIFGAVQAKIAAAYLAHWIRAGFSGAGESERQLNETRLKAALELLGGMGYLRGAMMKLGQVFANYPDVAPEEFASVLGYFHFEAPPMHFSLLREFVRDELRADPEDRFDDFETEAFAAASLGQVHRARLKGSGERVAVKIQYPGIARTIREDLSNLKTLLFPMRLHRDWDNLKDQYEDVLRMLDLETDYLKEAENLRIARSAFTDDEGIIVPKVYPELTTRRVLTMEFLDGVHLKPFLRSNPPQEVRDAYGAKIWLASLRLSYAKRLAYADPHPGNYFFRTDGRLGIVDFGCCRHLSDDDYEYSSMVEKALQTSPEALRESIPHAVDARPGQALAPDQVRLVGQLSEWFWEPMRHVGPFDFADHRYFQRGVALMGEVVRRRYLRSRPVNTWNSRSYFGVRAILYRLRARVDAGALLRRESTVQPDVPGSQQEHTT
jgi:aarF domain-containing kinase